VHLRVSICCIENKKKRSFSRCSAHRLSPFVMSQTDKQKQLATALPAVATRLDAELTLGCAVKIAAVRR
jgi:hypothetical protein